MGYWDTVGHSDEWYTPRHVFDALGCQFDMDVAGCQSPYSSVPAKTIIRADSLDQPWSGFIWMNPPFGGRNALTVWLDRFFHHANGIALTPDRTSAPWFQKFWPYADLVMFTPKLRFIRPDGSEGASPSNGTALWAVGPQAVQALLHAAERGLGVLAIPQSKRRSRI